jgi:uncharacterized protein (TIGR00369 family)
MTACLLVVDDFAAAMNEHRGGWNTAMGLTFLRVTGEEVVAEIELDERHTQPHGIVHGGVHCGIIETCCSTGAAVWAMAQERSVVGLENSTSFLKAARTGRVKIVARPVSQGRRSQVWEAKVSDAEGHLLSIGRVRLLCMEAGTVLAGGKIENEIEKLGR